MKGFKAISNDLSIPDLTMRDVVKTFQEHGTVAKAKIMDLRARQRPEAHIQEHAGMVKKETLK